MKVKAKEIAQRLSDLSELLEIAKEQAIRSTPAMIAQLIDSGLSLRQVARNVGRSPSYISLVARGVTPVSVGTFAVLAELYDKIDSSRADQ